MASVSHSKQVNGPTSSDGEFGRLDGFLLNVIPDEQDFRDYPYEPALIKLRGKIPPPPKRTVLNQGQEGACTGFGLAAVINRLLTERDETRTVSARMLYEMAKKFDEWEGEDYSGSSCRGAVRGWSNMGVCSETLAPYKAGASDWKLNIKQAKDARKTTLGAYYRINKRLSDYHAALNEVGVLYASARVHEGWKKSKVVNGEIPYGRDHLGGHAFAIVGYNEKGFHVQNSWGSSWGKNGVALWSYEDWIENIHDAWVFRLAISTPNIWQLGPPSEVEVGLDEGLFSRKPNRAEILGHFVHIDDGRFDDKGRYWTDLATVEQTAELVAKSNHYDHLLLYAHGGLNSIEASARRIVAMKEVFKKNRIYPFHFMYDTGLLEEIKDIVLRKKRDVDKRTSGISDFTDRLIEKAAHRPGQAIWREMKHGATSPFKKGMAGTQTIRAFLDALAKPDARPKKVHIVGHSTGAILLAALLNALKGESKPPVIHTCALMAPACTHDVFKNVYSPLLGGNTTSLRIEQLVIYNLTDDLEQCGTVTPLYRKSLLYLVSNSFEEKMEMPILGMQKFNGHISPMLSRPIFRIEISDGSKDVNTTTASEKHGRFDNDRFTMNNILHTILDEHPTHPFSDDDLRY